MGNIFGGGKKLVWVPVNEKLKAKCDDAESWSAKERSVSVLCCVHPLLQRMAGRTGASCVCMYFAWARGRAPCSGVWASVVPAGASGCF